MATGDKHRILCTKRKELIQIIQRDPDNILDELLALSIITEEEYNSFYQKEDIVTKIRELLIHIQKKGESTCQQFLECLEILFPGINQDLQPSGHVISQGSTGDTSEELEEGTEGSSSMENEPKNLGGTVSSEKGNAEGTISSLIYYYNCVPDNAGPTQCDGFPLPGCSLELGYH
ncbi:hypothetical protein KIL84_007243 [Mauremys mutica]|uniref:CARD domain-containing protein n=1 Tax=Mauremys mutica TaxID=74926 RepID=A0A9D3X2Q2_9SAUR|nr:hypothetical protein KIL84_007243 [Mauremys mutica]